MKSPPCSSAWAWKKVCQSKSRMISSRIEAAHRRRLKRRTFESRKHVLEYDDVMNKQREAVYGLRKQLMEGVDQKQLITR